MKAYRGGFPPRVPGSRVHRFFQEVALAPSGQAVDQHAGSYSRACLTLNT